jgi:hypothetical protein
VNAVPTHEKVGEEIQNLLALVDKLPDRDTDGNNPRLGAQVQATVLANNYSLRSIDSMYGEDDYQFMAATDAHAWLRGTYEYASLCTPWRKRVVS